MDKIKTEPADILRNKLNRLEEIFPELITEKNLDGEIIKAFDFDALKDIFNDKAADSEHYVFNWVGKTSARIKAYQPTNKTLRPCLDESRDWNTTRNLYIEGENLEVLKLLQQSYLHKVKMIYIDPPYNTGNDFIYRDNFTMDEDDLNAQIELFDDDGNKNFVKNPATNPRVHSDWCSMIYSRLLIARNFLADDGVIFISIDDNEQANLKKICDEVFGEKNFVNCIAVKMAEPTGLKMAHVQRKLPKIKEYVLVYKNGILNFNDIRILKTKWDSEYNTVIENLTKTELDYIKQVKNNEQRSLEEVKKVDKLLKKMKATSLSNVYTLNSITTVQGKQNFNYQNAWRICQTVSMSGGAKLLADKKKNDIGQQFFNIVTPNKKMYLINGDYSDNVDIPRIKILFADEYLSVNPCDFWQDIKTTGLDNEGFLDFKNGKKPLKLLNRMLQLVTDKDAIIMDFFSGSATTAHAVMELNAQDGGKRRFIMVQLPEKCDEKSEAYKAGYKTICDIGKERIRRAGDKIKSAAPLTTTDLDIGFRVLKLDESNYRDVAIDIAELRQEDIMNYVENIKGDRNGYDLLFDCLLRWGRELTLPHSVEEFDGATIHNYGGELAACFDKNITRRVIEYIAKKKVARAVFRDACFARDADKINADAIFKYYSPNTKVEVL